MSIASGRAHRVTRRAAAAGLLLLTAACATRVSTSAPNSSAEAAAVPRPDRILVMDFAVVPGAVRQDQGIGPRLQRAAGGADPYIGRATIAQEVQSALSDTLVQALSQAGLPAVRVPATTVPGPGDLVVSGRIVRIDEGNRTRRMGIGFGAGKSVVEGQADLSAYGPAGIPVVLQTYDGSADSGRRPGMAAGAGMAVAHSSAAMGALSGVSNIAGETRRSPVGQEAASLGKRLAHDIGTYAAGRGWISAAAVPAWSR